MARWSVNQVLELAPDDSARKAAKALTSPRHWSAMGSTETLVWGKCQGSGKDPYQVSVDLNGPAFRCTCPSRKFPCKHGVALLLLWSANDGSVADAAQPEAFAEEWATDRADKDAAKQEKAAKKAERIASGDEIGDPTARAKREAQRASNIDAGLEEFDRWICDLVRQGLAGARAKPYSFWDQAAARLVDAQAPALAERVREIGGEVLRREDWVPYLLTELARMSTLVQAWQGRAELDEVAVAELRTRLGWSRSAEDVRAGEVVRDRWVVVGRRQDGNERVRSQRTWLWGTTTAQWALLLDFAVGGGAFGLAYVTGGVLDAGVVFYPGVNPRRAIVVDGDVTDQTTALPLETVSAALVCVSAGLARDPWMVQMPVALGAVTVQHAGGGWAVADPDGCALPLHADFAPWTLLAHAGSEPCDLFAEWHEGGLIPVTVVVADGLVTL
jgi:hypothetical protein